MKNYKEITYRYLKKQRNRTLLTILGIILSVSMISAIGTIIVSARDGIIKNTLKNEGAYHGQFIDLDQNQIHQLTNHVKVEKVGVREPKGYSIVNKTTEDERATYGSELPYRYLEIKAYDENALDLLPFQLKEGRLPKNNKEIAMESWVMEYFNQEYKLGDTIQLDLGKRDSIRSENEEGANIITDETFIKEGEKAYTIVGFTQPNYIWPGELVTNAIVGLDPSLGEKGDYNAFFTLSDEKDAEEKIQGIAKDVGVPKENIFYNERLLRLYGESLNDSLNGSTMALLLFIVGLIVVSTIAVIYNSFHISVLERITQFGILRSVGATPKQIRGIVLKEAGILSVIGIPIGLASGILAMKMVFYVISILQGEIPIIDYMEVTISPMVLLIGAGVGGMTVFLSAIGPARKAGKVSPLEAVRNTGDIKLESFKKAKNSKLTEKILGIEGSIAHKNLGRNKKRFMITVFSMIISIVLFITFSFFSDLLFQSGMVGSEDGKDFTLYVSTNPEDANKITKELEALEDVQKVYKEQTINGEVPLEEEKLTKLLLETNNMEYDKKEKNKYIVSNVAITAIGDDDFKELQSLLSSGTIDVEKMNKEKGVLVINNTYVYNQSGKRSLIRGFNVQVGDSLPFTSYGSQVSKKNADYDNLHVLGVLEKGILSFKYNQNASLQVVTTEKVFQEIKGEDSQFYMQLHVEKTKDGSIENIRSYLKKNVADRAGISYIDYAEHAQENRTMATIMSIFLYGFVTLIALISAINIINTISTNIILRTKEIAMMKAVGMSQRGIKKMIAYEALFYGVYAAMIGGFIGTGLTYILFHIMLGITEIQWYIPWINIAIACGGATLIALLSGIYPLRRINKNIIVESMRSDH